MTTLVSQTVTGENSIVHHELGSENRPKKRSYYQSGDIITAGILSQRQSEGSGRYS